MGEVADIVDLLLGFERHNQVYVEIRMNYLWREKSPDLVVTVIAHDNTLDIGEVTSLASVSVKCLDTNLRNLRDVVTHALYALDFQLAVNELDATKKKEA
jgi:hypothetical protein